MIDYKVKTLPSFWKHYARLQENIKTRKPNKSLKLTANPLRLRLAVVGSLALTLEIKKNNG